MDYGTVQTRVRNRLNMGTDDPLSSLTDEYTNEALHLLESAHPSGWPWMRRVYTFSTTAGDGSYAFTDITTAAVLAKIIDVKLLSGSVYYPLTLISPEEAEQIYPVTTSRIPESWYVEGRTLYLYPSPDAAYTMSVRAVITETDLGGSTSTPVLPVVYHSAWVEQTLLLMYETLQDDAKIDMTQKRVNQWVDRMMKHGREYAGAPGVRVREWLS